MNRVEFKEWRERHKLTQQKVAEKFGVTRTTVQNWESGATPISPALEMGCQIWDARLKQEDPDRGPVTLVYSDGPMFINPYGPRRVPAMMRQEPHQTNAMALARVQRLWGRSDFHNPLIMEASGKPLWNSVELGRVVDGSDDGAPTLANLLRAIARQVKGHSSTFASTGRGPTPEEKVVRHRRIEELAANLEKLAQQAGAGADVRQQVQDTLAELRRQGMTPPESLVSNVAQACVAAWEVQ